MAARRWRASVRLPPSSPTSRTRPDISATSTRSTGRAWTTRRARSGRVRTGEEVLRAWAAAAVVKLQLRAVRAGDRVRRAGRPGQGGAGPPGVFQDGDEVRAQGHAAGFRRHQPPSGPSTARSSATGRTRPRWRIGCACSRSTASSSASTRGATSRARSRCAG
ncbi:hypothetical protein PR202_gb15182 [Eleusine coracana subsp. coracana]|uniref:Uncharacterized protein n=1 Tax=Eleusine coracana subsp. coracana TaxID=191504 RepID=A0AAV5EWY0_ELECO|nr:hypothetical protein PR202_gb15182 [Eleusine coracana subsp. coracana]